MTASEPETTSAEGSSGNGRATRWIDLLQVTNAEAWEKVQPGTLDRIIEMIEQAERRDNQRYWAEYWLRVAGTVCGLAYVIALCLLAMYFVDKGAATQAASLFGVGAASIVGAFVTQRLRGGSQN
ncbi:hypothetical protein FE391_00590 [Nonomuraea sp. KC401]|uniref:hypothetical protein n=1 Tax=unclassified Nonomuraea TaxID=2593643 RepID=UPI0010FF4172|nr:MULTISPECIES: hypothetical protein [unclassified Nonomuraea]NBE91832.1 hypothetical protein [Nonomuraea sp. K271]TLF86429.1 hypothetical protein FE391_00590 [Nonomuraea sp. KC401]